jgi:hypothetical protein
MDMMMNTENHVDMLTQCFLSGNYSLEPCRFDTPESVQRESVKEGD